MDKKFIITIDGGTTNTRVVLWENNNVIGIYKEEIGVRDTAIHGNNDRLKLAVKDSIEGLMKENELDYSQIKCIIASGMITSNVGLIEIPHVVAPVDVKKLAENTCSIMLQDICPIPICFIPGIKNSEEIAFDNHEEMDIMRGEETESIFLIDKYWSGKPMILMLPGSHAKMISVDKEGKITGCMTTLSGELLSVITNHTILADAVNKLLVDEEHYNKEYVIKGYDNAKKVGLNRACFSARILNQFITKDTWKIANYLLGAVLWQDIYAMKNTSAVRIERDVQILIAGKFSLQQALFDILQEDGYFTHIDIFKAENDIPMSAIGARLIAESF